MLPVSAVSRMGAEESPACASPAGSVFDPSCCMSPSDRFFEGSEPSFFGAAAGGACGAVAPQPCQGMGVMPGTQAPGALPMLVPMGAGGGVPQFMGFAPWPVAQAPQMVFCPQGAMGGPASAMAAFPPGNLQASMPPPAATPAAPQPPPARGAGSAKEAPGRGGGAAGRASTGSAGSSEKDSSEGDAEPTSRPCPQAIFVDLSCLKARRA